MKCKIDWDMVGAWSLLTLVSLFWMLFIGSCFCGA